MSKLPDSLPGRAPYEITQESRFDVDPDARPFLGTCVHYVFQNREVYRTKMDVFTGAHVGELTLVASCATQDAALAAQRLLNGSPVKVTPMLRLVKATP